MRRKHRKNPDSNTTLLIVALAAIGAGVYLVMQNKDKDGAPPPPPASPPVVPTNALPKGTYQDKQGNLVDSTTGQVIATVKEVDSLLKQYTGKGLVDNLKDLYKWATSGMVGTHGLAGYTDFGDPEVPAVKVAPYGYPQYGYASYRTVAGRI